MKVAGQTNIAANRTQTFSHGCEPEIWRQTSTEGRLSVSPRDNQRLRLGSMLDIAIDLEGVNLHPVLGKALQKITRGGPLELETKIVNMVQNEHIRTVGGLSIVKVCLLIDLEDSSVPSRNETVATYGLDINLTGALRPFGGALSSLEETLHDQAGGFVERLGQNIETSVYAHDKAS